MFVHDFNTNDLFLGIAARFEIPDIKISLCLPISVYKLSKKCRNQHKYDDYPGSFLAVSTYNFSFSFQSLPQQAFYGSFDE